MDTRSNYRISKIVHGNRCGYCIEKRHKFLFWKYWDLLYYELGWNCSDIVFFTNVEECWNYIDNEIKLNNWIE